MSLIGIAKNGAAILMRSFNRIVSDNRHAPKPEACFCASKARLLNRVGNIPFQNYHQGRPLRLTCYPKYVLPGAIKHG